MTMPQKITSVYYISMCAIFNTWYMWYGHPTIVLKLTDGTYGHFPYIPHHVIPILHGNPIRSH